MSRKHKAQMVTPMAINVIRSSTGIKIFFPSFALTSNRYGHAADDGFLQFFFRFASQYQINGAAAIFRQGHGAETGFSPSVKLPVMPFSTAL